MNDTILATPLMASPALSPLYGHAGYDYDEATNANQFLSTLHSCLMGNLAQRVREALTSAKIIPCVLCAPCVRRQGRRNANLESGRNVGSTLRPDFASLSAIRPDAIQTWTPTSCASLLRLVLLYYLLTPPDLRLFRSYCVGSSAIAF